MKGIYVHTTEGSIKYVYIWYVLPGNSTANWSDVHFQWLSFKSLIWRFKCDARSDSGTFLVKYNPTDFVAIVEQSR